MSYEKYLRFGRYRLLRRIATGGMGEVHLAKLKGPSGFEKLVVIKRLLGHRQTQTKYIDMFLAEARLAAQLNHPNIVQINDVGEIDGVHYIAMEYIRGKSLRLAMDAARTRRPQPLPHAYTLQIVTALAQGLAFAHAATNMNGAPMGLIHRDINPLNVLLSYRGEVKIIDFGIAKSGLDPDRTQAGTIKGTVVYMSPEQTQGLRLDKRSDQFSVGICLYEALTGTNPFHKETVSTSLEAIRQAHYPPITSWDPALQPFAAVINRALARLPNDRYPDCADLAADLEALQSRGLVPPAEVLLGPYLQQLFADEMAEEERLLTQTEVGEVSIAEAPPAAALSMPAAAAAAGPAAGATRELQSDHRPLPMETNVATVRDGQIGSGLRRRTGDQPLPRQLQRLVHTFLARLAGRRGMTWLWQLAVRRPEVPVALGAALLLAGGYSLGQRLRAPPTITWEAAASPTPDAPPTPSDPHPAGHPSATTAAPSQPGAAEPPVEPAAPAPEEPLGAAAGHRSGRSGRHGGRTRSSDERAGASNLLLSVLPRVAILHNGSAVGEGSPIHLRSGGGRLRVGTGSDPTRDPFAIEIIYRLEHNRITYSLESTPWADVSGPGGIALGRTPLSGLDPSTTSILELRRPRVPGSIRLTLRPGS